MTTWKGWWNSFPRHNIFPLYGLSTIFGRTGLLTIATLLSFHCIRAQSDFDTIAVDKKEKILINANNSQSSGAKADSVKTEKKKEKRHSPLKAALFSAAVPGLGQGYNKKYWKIPIVYAGFGGLGYALYYTTSEFYGYRNAYRLQVDGITSTYGSYKGIDDKATLKEYRDYFKRNVDISAICTAVWYTLNIVDAAVDAHLFEWNMKDDLSVSWRPVFMSPLPGGSSACLGVGIQMRM